jgi:subtilase family serine protease
MMRLNLFFLRTFPWLLATANAVNDHTKLMNIQRRKLMSVNRRATSMFSHEIIFAVRQKNLDIIEAELLDRCTPGHSNYQQWLSFSEIGLLTSNKLGATKVKDWLVKNNASITWESAHSDYIKATAKIEVWEYLFNTVFQEWNENIQPTSFYKTRKLDQKSPPLVLAKEYTIPAAVSMYLSAAFNTIQPPPILSFRRHLKWKDSSTKDTIHSDGIGLQGTPISFHKI